MAKIKVTASLLSDALFHGEPVRIVGISSFDKETGFITLEIEGPGVPNVKEVSSTFTREYTKVAFSPVEQSHD